MEYKRENVHSVGNGGKPKKTTPINRRRQ